MIKCFEIKGDDFFQICLSYVNAIFIKKLRIEADP